MYGISEQLPEGDRVWIVYDAVCVGVTVSHNKLEDNINKEGNLANYVQEEQLPWEPPEESKFEGCNEGTVHCPNHYEPGP